MPLASGRILGYDFDRMIVLFTMHNAAEEVRCAVSTSAMDDIERTGGVIGVHRVKQFARLRSRIEEIATRKFFAGMLEVDQPFSVLVRSEDLQG